jgi:hypothetical protein
MVPLLRPDAGTGSCSSGYRQGPADRSCPGNIGRPQQTGSRIYPDATSVVPGHLESPAVALAKGSAQRPAACGEGAGGSTEPPHGRIVPARPAGRRLWRADITRKQRRAMEPAEPPLAYLEYSVRVRPCSNALSRGTLLLSFGRRLLPGVESGLFANRLASRPLAAVHHTQCRCPMHGPWAPSLRRITAMRCAQSL